MGGERPLWADKLDGKDGVGEKRDEGVASWDGVGEKRDEGVASWDLGVVCC